MAWNENTMTALRQWAGRDTADTWHPLDEGRFYDFIYALWQEVHALWDEALAREMIANEFHRLHPKWDDKLVGPTVEKAHGKGTTILDFLCHLSERGLI